MVHFVLSEEGDEAPFLGYDCSSLTICLSITSDAGACGLTSPEPPGRRPGPAPALLEPLPLFGKHTRGSWHLQQRRTGAHKPAAATTTPAATARAATRCWPGQPVLVDRLQQTLARSAPARPQAMAGRQKPLLVDQRRRCALPVRAGGQAGEESVRVCCPLGVLLPGAMRLLTD